MRSTSQIIQEKRIKDTQKNKLEEISSTHIKPDYTLVNGNIVKSYLDAKNISVDLFTNKEAAFQIRSYGWSAGVPCAFLSNFEQFAIYDCKEPPKKDMPANVGVIQLRIDEYLDNFEVLNTHLDRVAVYNNQLEKLYSQHQNEGQNTVDIYFNEFLTDFRVKLANELYTRNRHLSEEQLNYYVQIMIDRIIFIRVCESKQIEQKEILKEFVKEGFWERFKINCYKEFYTHYDGAMFSDFDEEFLTLDMDNEVFEQFVGKLYYPYPYKFDAIPVHVIARVYESFLSYSLVIKEHSVCSVLKEEYVKTKGAVPTEQKIAEAVCGETLDLEQVTEIEDLFRIRVLDPCCGSGIFLVTVYEKLADRLKQLAGRENPDYCIEGQGKLYLTVSAKQKIMQNCLYGLDLDRTAVEVTKMSLALKLIDDSDPFLYSEIGIWGEKFCRILTEILSAEIHWLMPIFLSAARRYRTLSLFICENFFRRSLMRLVDLHIL